MPATIDLGLAAGGLEVGQRVGQRLVLAEGEPSLVVGLLVGAAGPDQDVVHPAPLHRGDVLHEAADAQRSGGGRPAGLLVGEAEGGDADGVSLLGQEGQQALALVADRGNGSGHCGLLGGGQFDGAMVRL